MDPIHKIQLTDLETVIQKIGYNKEILINTVILNQIKENWGDIIGPVFVNQAQPYKVEGDVLFLRVAHSAYKMEIGFLKDSILKAANKLFASPLLSKLTITTGNMQYTPPQKATKQIETLEGKSELVETIQKEDDEFIREKLLNFIKKLKKE